MENSSSPSLLPSPMNGSSGTPMIVDVSIDTAGQQIYSVRNTDGDCTRERQPLADKTNLKRKGEFGLSASKKAQPEDPGEIWSHDVETAFKEALEIIPKKGLHKIKISGRSCGRNELISDYILSQTGKLRSRKQVSSHIQVIKNLHKERDLLDLIENGPAEDDETRKRFETTFSAISLDKSIGKSCTSPVQVSYPSSAEKRDTAKSLIFLESFDMNYIHFEKPLESFTFSRLKEPQFMEPPLRIRENADLDKRFPRLNECASNRLTPILHGMTKLCLPTRDQNLEEGHFEASSVMHLTSLPLTDRRHSCLNVIYSFGKVIATSVDDLDNRLNRVGDSKEGKIELKFAGKFWSAFFNGLLKSFHVIDEKDLEARSKFLVKRKLAVKGITIKQVIFEQSSGLVMEDGVLNTQGIRAILLWEFLLVNEPQEAKTTLRNIHMPEKPPVREFDPSDFLVEDEPFWF